MSLFCPFFVSFPVMSVILKEDDTLKEKENILASLAATAILAGGCLWGIELFRNGASPTTCLGLVCAAAAAGLLAALLSAHHRQLDDLEQSHREELTALEQDHTQALAEMQSRTQTEMEAFRSGLSHSLRMPVAIIQGYAELLTSGVIKDTDVAVEYLQKISQRSQYMTEAISRQFSVSDSMDSSKLTYSDLDLISLVRQAAADMQTAAEEQGVKIQVVSSEESLPMQADTYLLNRVLFNLLENSLKYMGRPGVITIRVLRLKESASVLVQDDGLGLPTEEASHIFEPNYQGSNHTGGQGYGLYLVRRAVEGHGGTVSAQSAPGRGMGISMTLPLSPIHA